MALHKIIFIGLSVIKWPLAFLSLASFPSMVWSLWQEILSDIGALTFVFLGGLTYGAFW